MQQPGRSNVGATWRVVQIEEIDADGKAHCVDRFGKQIALPISVTRGKGVRPAVGDQWVIDRSVGGRWSFAAILNTVPPIVTGSRGANVALGGLLEVMDDAGLVQDQTTEGVAPGGGGGLTEEEADALYDPLGAAATAQSDAQDYADTQDAAILAVAEAYADTVKSDLLGGAPSAALDTIKELGDQLTADESAVAAITTSLAGKASSTDSRFPPTPGALPDGDFVVTESGLYVAKTTAQVKALLGLGTAAYTSSTDYQPIDPELTALASLVSAADKIPFFDGSGSAGLLTRSTDGTFAGNSDTNIATQKATKTYADTKVPATRQVNNKSLSSDITLGASDIKVGASVRLLPTSRVTGATPVAQVLVPINPSGATVSIAAGTQYLAHSRSLAGTIAAMYLMVSATSLTGSQTIEVALYAESSSDGWPGARQWQQNFTIGTSTGTFTVSSLSLALPDTGFWLSVFNPSGNSGSVTLRGGNLVSTARQGVQTGNSNWASVLSVISLASSVADLSSYQLRSGSTTAVLNTDAAAVFPYIGAVS